jgi:Fe-S oxidoreductase
VHHSQFLLELIAAGRLRLNRPWDGGRVTYHDSCYLGRYNQVYDAPRQVLRARPGLEVVEMRRSRARGFCCGGGGSGIWMEHEPGQRINDVRAAEIRQLLRRGPAPPGGDLAAVACPFCLIMLEGAADAPPLKDIAEVIAESL